MNDWGLSVLERYPLEVKTTKKVRGALLCDTDRGYFLLQEYRGTQKHLQVENEILNFLTQRGGYLTDTILPDREANLMVENEEKTHYIMKRWYLMPECNVNSRNELCQSVLLLAKLHLLLRKTELSEEMKGCVTREHSIIDTNEKHTRELRRVRSYIWKKKKKNELERMIAGSFDAMYEQAVLAEEHLEKSCYQRLLEEGGNRNFFCHGSYHQHNILIGNGQIAAVNFEGFTAGVQLGDLYYFMRKILEKHNWNPEIGRMMLREYRKIMPLSAEEMEVLFALFEYPEKYWKQINFYYNNKKSWLSKRSMDKLARICEQRDSRNAFLKALR